MLGTIYVGLAGMKAYSKGLDLISNNVANLNTAGFKAGLASFSDVIYRNSGGATAGTTDRKSEGAGVSVNSERQNFGQGDLRSTDNPLDAAVVGKGFFVLERDGQTYYTRAGTFEIAADGILTERTSGAKVMMSSEGSSLGTLQFDPHRVFPPRATTAVTVTGTLSRTGGQTYDQTNLVVNDTAGGQQTLRVRYTRDGADTLVWTAEVLNATNQVLGRGTIRFNADGSPHEDNVPIEVTVTPTDTPAFTFTLSAGAAGSFVGITSLQNGANSGVGLLRQDGLRLGTFTSTNFDEEGNLRVTYSNGETKTIGRLVLASFDSDTDIESLGGGLYMTREGRTPRLAAGLEFGLGRVSGSNVELSNVDLTEQFTDLIIIQRGYQASSQMTSVANEMMQQLMQMQDRR